MAESETLRNDTVWSLMVVGILMLGIGAVVTTVGWPHENDDSLVAVWIGAGVAVVGQMCTFVALVALGVRLGMRDY